jgi:hypothetical protein
MQQQALLLLLLRVMPVCLGRAQVIAGIVSCLGLQKDQAAILNTLAATQPNTSSSSLVVQ